MLVSSIWIETHTHVDPMSYQIILAVSWTSTDTTATWPVGQVTCMVSHIWQTCWRQRTSSLTSVQCSGKRSQEKKKQKAKCTHKSHCAHYSLKFEHHFIPAFQHWRGTYQRGTLVQLRRDIDTCTQCTPVSMLPICVDDVTLCPPPALLRANRRIVYCVGRCPRKWWASRVQMLSSVKIKQVCSNIKTLSVIDWTEIAVKRKGKCNKITVWSTAFDSWNKTIKLETVVH